MNGSGQEEFPLSIDDERARVVGNWRLALAVSGDYEGGGEDEGEERGLHRAEEGERKSRVGERKNHGFCFFPFLREVGRREWRSTGI
ncbi:hypothetical protein HPP92_004574 [Vanilla planifolia]|uniref:Uncharacterized protein n=1 Tax=Vanilla planifolia TaxID=51239 RepID=A0A835RJQ8_VANPL|nr:hypothetical protein HPP92_004574 [Vanilla planifolia]